MKTVVIRMKDGSEYHIDRDDGLPFKISDLKSAEGVIYRRGVGICGILVNYDYVAVIYELSKDGPIREKGKAWSGR